MGEHKHYPPTSRESDWQEAAYVAYLLGLPIKVPFPKWLNGDENDSAHLVVAVMAIVDDSIKVCEAGRNDSISWAADMRTLKHCRDVMNGVPTVVDGESVTLFPDIRDNGWFGEGIFRNRHHYATGIWHRWGHKLPRGRYG